MEFEFWWLLAFPLFFVLGWLAARVDIRQVVTESRALPNSYFRGLNFLLNEQPDKGHRGVSRSRQARTPNHRPALCAGRTVPPPRRTRSRDPHARKPA
jgi:lipopolysaccharide biosynthesis regulator YciM